MKLLVFLLLGFQITLAKASTNVSSGQISSQCYDQIRAFNYNKAFKIKISDFKYSKELCNPENKLIALYETFDFIQSLEFGEDVQREVIPGIVSTNYYQYLVTNIKSIVRETHADADGSMDPETSEMSIGMSLLNNPDIVERSGILIHEARHASKENNGYEHVKCKSGGFKGEEACDRSFATKGSYAVEVEYFARLYYTAVGLPQDLKEAAKKSAVETLKENFNEKDMSF